MIVQINKELFIRLVGISLLFVFLGAGCSTTISSQTIPTSTSTAAAAPAPETQNNITPAVSDSPSPSVSDIPVDQALQIAPRNPTGQPIQEKPADPIIQPIPVQKSLTVPIVHSPQIIPTTPTPSAPVQNVKTLGCCKTCTTGKACGNSCISRSYTCHKAPGCACDAY